MALKFQNKWSDVIHLLREYFAKRLVAKGKSSQAFFCMKH